MISTRRCFFIAIVTLILFSGCSPSGDEFTEIKQFPVENFDGLVSMTNVSLDTEQKADGKASLRIAVAEPKTVLLYESGDIDVEGAILMYRASVRSENLEGMAYLEMWCDFADGNSYFSRGLDTPWTGSLEWSTIQTPFLLKEGQNPVNVRLNLVVDGAGTVWIDDIRLLTAPLPQ